MDYKHIAKTTIVGVLFTAVFISIVVFLANSNKEKILFNEKQVLINELNQLVTGFDNPITEDFVVRKLDLYGNKREIIIYSAKKNNQVFAILIKHTYPKGYSGDITLLTALDTNYKILGSRVLQHKETPGLGDKIEIKKSNWMLSFDGIRLEDKTWKVKKRGGDFDSWSGATVTPSAILTAISELVQTLQLQKL